MPDPEEREFVLDCIAHSPDGTVTLVGRVGVMRQKFVLDRDSWRKVISAVEWSARQLPEEGRT
jgi:hypothetical protein